jgi:undecaprenyl-diphosphatase
MTTYLVYALIHGFTQILPVGGDAHLMLISHFLGWPHPEGFFLGGLFFATTLALLVYFRHDWASIFSSFLQVIIYRKRPMTLDERLLFFLTLVSIFPAVIWTNFREPIAEFFVDPIWTALSVAVFTVPLWIVDYTGRKTKGMFDWNWVDCIWVGIGECLLFIPGCGPLFGCVMMALFRNYSREAALKFSFYSVTPVMGAWAYSLLHDFSFKLAAPVPGMSWLTFVVACLVAFFASLLAVGGLMGHIQRRGLNQYVAYRFIIGIAGALVIWLKARQMI